MFYVWILFLFFVNKFRCNSTFPLNNSNEIINVNETLQVINLLNFTTTSNNDNNTFDQENILNFTSTSTISPLPFFENITNNIHDLSTQHYLSEKNKNQIPILTSINNANNSNSILSIKCLPNQELKSCGSVCPPTCGILEPKCKSNCIEDICQCKKGFVVHQNGTCIHPDNCPKTSIVKQCPSNSHLSPCGTLCPPTCSLPNPTICSLQCIVDDCVCDSGFVLDNENHKCIKLEECPKMKKICDQNESFHECGTKCEGTCNEPFPAFCSDECLKNVCQCSEGFVRNEAKKCILLSKCLL